MTDIQKIPFAPAGGEHRTLGAKAVKGARILLLGVTYKKNIADERESPARPIARRLAELGASLEYADPFVASWAIDGVGIQRREDVIGAVRDANLVVLLQNHDQFDLDAVAAAAHAVFDTRGVLHGPNVETL